MADVDLVNDALLQIGVASITAGELATPTLQASKVANQVYAQARDAVLRMHTWGFATYRATLSLVGAVSQGVGNRFTLPASPYCLRVQDMFDTTAEWRVEGRELITPDATAKIRFIARETDTTKYDAIFSEVLVYYLASQMAFSLTRDAALVKLKWEQFQTALNGARIADIEEDAPRQQASYDMISKAYMLVGASSLSSLDDSRLAIALRTYEAARDETLAAHAWNFAIKRSAALSAGTNPSYEYSNAWTLPTDCLRVLEVYDSTNAWVSTAWRIESGALICNLAAAPKVKYIAQITDTTKYSSVFINTLVYLLASKLAPIAGQSALATPNYEVYMRTLVAAKLSDDKESGADIITAKALLLLGVSATSLDGEKSQIANETYKTTRDEILKANAWNFALKQSAALSAATAPNWEYTNSFELPTDCLRVLEVYNVSDARVYDWKVVGYTSTDKLRLMINSTSAEVKYIAQITDTAKFDALFTNCLVYLLASRLAMPLAGQDALVSRNYELYQKTLLDAKLLNSQESMPDVITAKAIALLGTSMASLDNSKLNLAVSLYASARDEVLRAYSWNFAIKRSAALATTTAPNFGYTYAYTLPTDSLRVLELYGSISPWRVEAGILLTDDATAKVKYIAQITDTTKFSASFTNALLYNMASKLAIAFTGNVGIATQNYELYQKTVAEARLADAQEAVPVSDTVNLALALIGASSLASMDDQLIRIVERLYIPTLKETLAAHEWNFAVSRATLTEYIPVPSFGYAHRYILPSDCLRVVELYDSDSEWKVEGPYLNTDDTTAKIIYISYVSDTTKFSAIFISALMYHLASKYAVPVAKDKGLQKNNYELFINTIAEARGIDSREGTADPIISNVLINARR